MSGARDLVGLTGVRLRLMADLRPVDVAVHTVVTFGEVVHEREAPITRALVAGTPLVAHLDADDTAVEPHELDGRGALLTDGVLHQVEDDVARVLLEQGETPTGKHLLEPGD